MQAKVGPTADDEAVIKLHLKVKRLYTCWQSSKLSYPNWIEYENSRLLYCSLYCPEPQHSNVLICHFNKKLNNFQLTQFCSQNGCLYTDWKDNLVNLWKFFKVIWTLSLDIHTETHCSELKPKMTFHLDYISGKLIYSCWGSFAAITW